MVQPYGGSPQRAAETTQPPRIPGSVRNAVTVMFAGAAAGVLHVIVHGADALLMSAPNQLSWTAHQAAAAGTSTGTLVVVTEPASSILGIAFGGIPLISALLFSWIALECRHGRNWARITGTVFFGIDLLSFLDFGLRESGLDRIWAGVTPLIGLVAVILLWQGSASDYFRASKRQQTG